MRPIQPAPKPAQYALPATLQFKGAAGNDVYAALHTYTPSLQTCLKKVWLVVAAVRPNPPANITDLKRALRAIEPRVGTIYKKAAKLLLGHLGAYCSYCESPLSALVEVEHAVPKAEFPTFAVDWKNFLISCGPCNTQKGNQPSRASLFALRNYSDLDPNEQVSYDELRTNYLKWPDLDATTCRLLEYLECSRKPDPCGMRVQRPESGERTFDERQEAFSGADHQEAA